MLLDEEMHARLEPAALICSVLAEMHRDPEKRDRPYEVRDFLPGAGGVDSAPQDPNEPDEEMKAFIDALNRGETMQQTPESLEALKHTMENYLKPAADAGKPTQIGPRGKMERA